MEDGLLENEKGDEYFVSKPNNPNLHRWWIWVLQSAIFLCSLTLLILSQYSESPDAACTRKLSTYCSSSPQLTSERERARQIRVLELTHTSTAPRSSNIPPHHLPRRFPPALPLPQDLPQKSTTDRKSSLRGVR